MYGRPDPGEAADLLGHNRMHILNSPYWASMVCTRIVFLARMNNRYLPDKRGYAMSQRPEQEYNYSVFVLLLLVPGRTLA